MMKIKYFKLKISIFILIFLSIISCSSCNENKSPIPVVYVDFYVNLNEYNQLTIPGSYEYVTGGLNGILIYHTMDDTYQAYERTCPHDPDCGKVYMDQANFKAVDSVCCGSEFSLLLNGSVSQGPSLYPLKMYSCVYDINSNTLHIKN